MNQNMLRPASALLWLAGVAAVAKTPTPEATQRLVVAAAMTTTIIAALDRRSAELREVIRICSAIARYAGPSSASTDAR